MEQNDPSVLDFRELLWKARRHKWLALLPVVLVLCGTWVYLMLTPPVYESFAVISMDDLPQVSAALAPLVRADGGENPRQKQVLLLKMDSRVHSRSFLEVLATRLGYVQNPEFMLEATAAARRWKGITPEEYAMSMAINRLGKQIVVAPAGESLTRIAVMSGDPEVARKLATMISDQLLSESKESTIERATARGEFSADQITIYEERLRKSETALREHQESVIGRKLSSNPITDANYDGAKGLIADARDEMDLIRNRLRSDLGAWQSGGGGLEGPPELRSGKVSELEGRLNEFETSYAVAVLGGPARAADAATIKLKIGSARQALFAEYLAQAQASPSNLSAAARDAAAGVALDRSELRSLRQKEQYLSRLADEYSRLVQSSPKEEMDLERLKSEVETNRDLLLALKKEATSSHISAALQTSQLGMRLEVVESPQLPLTPSYPDPRRIMGMALFVGPLLGVGLVMIVEKLGAALQTLEQAEREMGVRVIGTIPRIEGWSQPGSYLQRYWPVLSIVLVLLATAVFYTLHATVLNSSRTSETESVQPRP